MVSVFSCGANGRPPLQLPAGLAFIDGLREGNGSKIGKNFPIDDRLVVALELVSDDELAAFPSR